MRVWRVHLLCVWRTTVAGSNAVSLVPREKVGRTPDRQRITRALPALPQRRLTIITHSERRLTLPARRFIETSMCVWSKQDDPSRPAGATHALATTGERSRVAAARRGPIRRDSLTVVPGVK